MVTTLPTMSLVSSFQDQACPKSSVSFSDVNDLNLNSFVVIYHLARQCSNNNNNNNDNDDDDDDDDDDDEFRTLPCWGELVSQI